MLILAINTASSRTGIALLGKNRYGINLLSESSWKSNNDEAEKLMPGIDKMLKKTGKKYSNIEKVIVIKGPGSFTGLRVGVTVANTLAYLNNCELSAIDTFKFWWEAQDSKKDSIKKASNKNNALLIFAGSKGVYSSLSPTKKPELKNLDQLNKFLNKNNIEIVFGDISKEQREILKVKFSETKKSFGKIMEKIAAKPLKSVKIVKPYYIKEPGITVSKKKIF